VLSSVLPIGGEQISREPPLCQTTNAEYRRSGILLIPCDSWTRLGRRKHFLHGHEKSPATDPKISAGLGGFENYRDIAAR
jgi:hypothetical protein